MSDLVLITLTILLPIAPAYILYRALPARATVKGPFKGLNIQLSGAFAGYFLLVLTVFGFISMRPKAPEARIQVWEIRGKINWNRDGTPVDIQRMQLSSYPSLNNRILGDGHFIVQVVPEVLDTGKLRFPTLMIEHPDFQPVTVDLNDTQSTFGQQVRILAVDSTSRQVEVKDSIDLEKKAQLPPYKDSGQQPQVASYLEPGE